MLDAGLAGIGINRRSTYLAIPVLSFSAPSLLVHVRKVRLG